MDDMILGVLHLSMLLHARTMYVQKSRRESEARLIQGTQATKVYLAFASISVTFRQLDIRVTMYQKAYGLPRPASMCRMLKLKVKLLKVLVWTCSMICLVRLWGRKCLRSQISGPRCAAFGNTQAVQTLQHRGADSSFEGCTCAEPFSCAGK